MARRTTAGTVIDIAREMRARGLVCGTVGNVSVRHGDGLLITPSRHDYEDLGPADLVELTLDGQRAHAGPGLPSMESGIHVAVYRARPDVTAVVHTHSPYATARSFDPSPLEVRTEERAYFGLERVYVADPAEAGSPELARGAVAALGKGPVALLARHGVLAVGASARAALEMACVVEHQAQIESLVAAREWRRDVGALLCRIGIEDGSYGQDVRPSPDLG